MKTKEAIERVRSRFDKWALDEEDLAALQAFGLVSIESDDERIRKDIIEYLKLVGKGDGDYAQPMIDKWIAYLEKQKEEEGYEAIPVESTLEYKLGFKAGKESEKQKEQKPVISDEAIRDGVVHFGITQYQIDYWLKKHINVVEQKPAEWSEEDENDLQQCIKIVVGWEKDYDIAYSPYSNFLKSLPERFNLQPKQEWSIRRISDGRDV